MFRSLYQFESFLQLPVKHLMAGKKLALSKVRLYKDIKLFDNVRNNMLLLPLENQLIVQILLFGSEKYDSTANKVIISSAIEFIIKSKRFEDALVFRPNGKIDLII